MTFFAGTTRKIYYDMKDVEAAAIRIPRADGTFAGPAILRVNHQAEQARLVQRKTVGVLDSTRIVVFAHGNYADIGAQAPLCEQLMRMFSAHCLIWEYSGYPHYKERDATFENIDQDANDVMWFVTNKLKILPANVIIVGQSIGTGPSARLARRMEDAGTPVGLLVLITPYTSIQALAEFHAPTVVALLGSLAGLSEGWDTLENTRRSERTPLVVLHGAADVVIPFSQAQQIVAARADDSRTLALMVESNLQVATQDGYDTEVGITGHGDVFNALFYEPYKSRLAEFIASLPWVTGSFKQVRAEAVEIMAVRHDYLVVQDFSKDYWVCEKAASMMGQLVRTKKATLDGINSVGESMAGFFSFLPGVDASPQVMQAKRELADVTAEHTALKARCQELRPAMLAAWEEIGAKGPERLRVPPKIKITPPPKGDGDDLALIRKMAPPKIKITPVPKIKITPVPKGDDDGAVEPAVIQKKLEPKPRYRDGLKAPPSSPHQRKRPPPKQKQPEAEERGVVVAGHKPVSHLRPQAQEFQPQNLKKEASVLGDNDDSQKREGPAPQRQKIYDGLWG